MSEDPFKYDRGVLSPLKAQQTISTFTADTTPDAVSRRVWIYGGNAASVLKCELVDQPGETAELQVPAGKFIQEFMAISKVKANTTNPIARITLFW